jgi:hypothetical protein
MGNKFDKTASKAFDPGGFAAMPAKCPSENFPNL